MSKASGGAFSNGPQPPSGERARRRRSRAWSRRDCPSGESAKAPASRKGRGVHHAGERLEPEPGVGPVDPGPVARGVGGSEDLTGEPGPERAAVSCGRADEAPVFDRPRPVGGLIVGQSVGGEEQGGAVDDPAGLDGRGQGGGELEPGQPPVVERPVAAVAIPPPGPGQPAVGVERRRRGDRPAELDPLIEGPGGVAVVVAGVAMVLGRPAGDLGGEVGQGPGFGRVVPRAEAGQGDCERGRDQPSAAARGCCWVRQ